MSSQIAATKSNLLILKNKLVFSKRSFELLDKKQKILMQELVLAADRAKTLEQSMIAVFHKAFGLLKKVKFTMGECKQFSELTPPENGVHMSVRSVMGVEIPVVTLDESEKPHDYVQYGFLNTNSVFDEMIKEFAKLKKLIVEFSHVENMVFSLTAAVKKTKSRANALEHVVIPNTEKNLKLITKALEEKEREVFSKLKLIKNK